MNHFMKQLVAYDPSHPSRNVLNSRFSTSDQVFPLDIEAREVFNCSGCNATEIKFRFKK